MTRFKNPCLAASLGKSLKTFPALFGTLLVFAGSLFSIASGCGGPVLDEKSFAAAFEKIHHNIYEVYRLQDPARSFEVLSRSCAGEELEKQVYEYLKCLKVQSEFNTAVTIVDVIYNDIRLMDFEGFTASVYCKWVVIGKIRHPTHIHRKVNLNEAVYRVQLGDEGPRIISYDLITNQALEGAMR